MTLPSGSKWDARMGPAPGIRWEVRSSTSAAEVHGRREGSGIVRPILPKSSALGKTRIRLDDGRRRSAPPRRKPERRSRARARVHAPRGNRERWCGVCPPAIGGKLKRAPGLPQAPLPSTMGNCSTEGWRDHACLYPPVRPVAQATEPHRRGT